MKQENIHNIRQTWIPVIGVMQSTRVAHGRERFTLVQRIEKD